ncbi:MAG: hypothetical protein WA771_10395 [Chthoniobacterales bacterium]
MEDPQASHYRDSLPTSSAATAQLIKENGETAFRCRSDRFGLAGPAKFVTEVTL